MAKRSKTKKPPPENRTETGRFQEGQSGNPGGRPKMLKELKERIQLRGDELVDSLFVIAFDPPKVRRAGRRVFLDGPAPRDRILAIEKLLAYGYGRPVLAVELSGPGGAPVETREIDKLTSGERAQRLMDLFIKAGARVIAKEAETEAKERDPNDGGSGGA